MEGHFGALLAFILSPRSKRASLLKARNESREKPGSLARPFRPLALCPVLRRQSQHHYTGFRFRDSGDVESLSASPPSIAT